MEHEATLRFVTNLDRAGIEAQLRQVAQKAAERQLPAVAELLSGADGESRQALDEIISASIVLLRQGSGQQGLADQLEMLQLNLPNLG